MNTQMEDTVTVRDERMRVTEDRTYTNGNGHSLPTLLRELRDQGVALLRQEAALARAEMMEKAQIAGRNVGYLMFGAVLAGAGLVVLLFAAVAGVAVALASAGLEVHAAWLAPLLVGGLFALLGWALVSKGKSGLKHLDPVPERTVDTMKENQQWIATKAR